MQAKPKITWVVVANGSKARVFADHGPGQGLTELPAEGIDDAHRPSQTEFSDRAGRSFDSHGIDRHAMEPVTDPQVQARQTLARKIAARLEAARTRRNFDRLAIVAAPKALGDLRHALSQASRDSIFRELSKDLTEAKASSMAEAVANQSRLS